MPANMPQGPSDIFDHLLPLGFQAYPDRVREVNAIIVFKITGDDGGMWVLNCETSPPKIEKSMLDSIPEAYEGAKSTVKIETDSDSFKRMMLSPDEGMELFYTGKLLITGELEVISRMKVFFDLSRSEPGIAKI